VKEERRRPVHFIAVSQKITIENTGEAAGAPSRIENTGEAAGAPSRIENTGEAAGAPSLALSVTASILTRLCLDSRNVSAAR
jgi:hypothetical protein